MKKCKTCGEPTTHGRALCEKHLAIAAAWQRSRKAKLAAKGKCIKCGAEPKRGFSMCVRHLEAGRQAKAARDRTRRRAGRCQVCGGPRAANSVSRCAEHLEVERRRTATFRARARGASVVYFIRSGDEGPIKIGWSKSGVLRLWALQVGNPEQLHVIARMPGTIDDEAALHERFRHLHIRGEWFAPGQALLSFVRRLSP